MRVAQMVIAPVTQAEVEVVDELPESARGAGGFGSTGHRG
jgi:dUTP pyrophosphatase